MTRQDIELYVMGQYDGDAAALERAVAEDPALAAILADEARLEMTMRAAASAATFCAACDDLVRAERCDSCGAAVRPGGYTVERVLVSNAHGRMYGARDADGRKVALKELAFVQVPSVAAQAAFEREAKFLRALEHPAIPKFLASFEEGQGVHARYYLAQELVEGSPLDRLDEHWYSEAEIIDIARQVLAVLVYLQELSPMVIHRDIKPANLIKRADGTIAVVDFGAAHVHGTTVGSTTIGTFGYMPLEQLAGEVDATTDLYALGATLVYLMTRQEPWRVAQNRTAINASARVRTFIDRLMAPAPKDRFPSAKAALAALDAPPVAKRRPRIALFAAAGAAVLAAGGGGFYALHHKAPPVHHIEMTMPAMPAMPAMPPMPAMPMPPMPPTHMREHAHMHSMKVVSWTLDKTAFADFVMLFAATCNVNTVVPDTIEVPVTVDLETVPCDMAFEAVLSSHGLWYAYDETANLVRIAPRKELDREAEAAAARPSRVDVALPEGSALDMDMKNAPLRATLGTLAKASGANVNLVMPDSIDGKVTVRLKHVTWRSAFEAVLASHALWYRYEPNGRIIRVAPRKELDREDEESAARGGR